MDPSNSLPVRAEATAAAAADLVGEGGTGSTTGRMPSTVVLPAPFRFTQAEVVKMEAHLQQLNNAFPNGSVIKALANKFTASAERAGSKVGVLSKQVWSWFKNRKSHRRYRNPRKMLPTASGGQKSAIASASAHSVSSTGAFAIADNFGITCVVHFYLVLIID